MHAHRFDMTNKKLAKGAGSIHARKRANTPGSIPRRGKHPRGIRRDRLDIPGLAKEDDAVEDVSRDALTMESS
jgi:hypothetical protein